MASNEIVTTTVPTRPKPRKRKNLTAHQIEQLLAQADAEVKSTPNDLAEAKELAHKAGYFIESDLAAIAKSNRDGTTASAFTGGHSNTDHVVLVTGDYVTDRIAELRRNYLTRSRVQQPEAKCLERWDKPRAPGERRRRIVRTADMPSAPPEPCLSGYSVFVGQMTTKVRHDRPNELHSQARAIQEIAKMWRMGLTEEERKYYNDFCDETRKEYRKQQMEFRATGAYTPSDKFEKIEGTGLWLRKTYCEKNNLEREIATYDRLVFPQRPPELEDDYRRRFLESVERRKAKIRAQRMEIANLKKQETPPTNMLNTDSETKIVQETPPTNMLNTDSETNTVQETPPTNKLNTDSETKTDPV